MPKEISPPVSGGLERIKSPSEEHSTMGKPMLCLENEKHYRKPHKYKGQVKRTMNNNNFMAMTNQKKLIKL